MDVFDAMIFSFVKKEIYTFIRIIYGKWGMHRIVVICCFNSFMIFLNIIRDKKIFSYT